MLNLPLYLLFPIKKFNFFINYHLVMMSPWPLLVSLMTMNFLLSILMYFKENMYSLMFFNFMLIFILSFFWWKDIDSEASMMGEHTKFTYSLMKVGMLLFIVSEVMFFFSFFWSFFHSSLNPDVEMGLQWPPLGVESMAPYEAPLLNSVLLVSSGVTLTYSHYSLMSLNYKASMNLLMLTLLLGLLFTLTQLVEYYEASFTMADSTYGSIFFMSTGFHGVHVIVGSMFLLNTLFRMMNFKFSITHHSGFNNSAWYWHFVDVVWLFLFVLMYWWFS